MKTLVTIEPKIKVREGNKQINQTEKKWLKPQENKRQMKNVETTED